MNKIIKTTLLLIMASMLSFTSVSAEEATLGLTATKTCTDGADPSRQAAANLPKGDDQNEQPTVIPANTDKEAGS